MSDLASVMGLAVRITRLDTNGVPASGDLNTTYTFTSLIRLTFAPDYVGGTLSGVRSADGFFKGQVRLPSALRKVTLELAVCEPDARLTQLAQGGTLILDEAAAAIGYASILEGNAPGSPVALEAWTYATEGGRPSDPPYWHWLFPYAKLRLTGDSVIANDALLTTFVGWARPNPNFGVGINDGWTWTSDRPYQYVRAVNVPPATVSDV